MFGIVWLRQNPFIEPASCSHFYRSDRQTLPYFRGVAPFSLNDGISPLGNTNGKPDTYRSYEKRYVRPGVAEMLASGSCL